MGVRVRLLPAQPLQSLRRAGRVPLRLGIGKHAKGFVITIRDSAGNYYGDGCVTVDGAVASMPIALTKADKLKPAEVDAVVARTLEQIRKRPASFPRVLATSSEKGLGIPTLRAEVKAACEV